MFDFYFDGIPGTVLRDGSIRSGGVQNIPWNSSWIRRLARHEPELYRRMLAACPPFEKDEEGQCLEPEGHHKEKE